MRQRLSGGDWYSKPIKYFKKAHYTWADSLGANHDQCKNENYYCESYKKANERIARNMMQSLVVQQP